MSQHTKLQDVLEFVTSSYIDERFDKQYFVYFVHGKVF